jgi:hypothetical protein
LAFQTWRTCHIIAQQRTDVAGAMRKRPSKPAISYSSPLSNQWGTTKKWDNLLGKQRIVQWTKIWMVSDDDESHYTDSFCVCAHMKKIP